MTQRSYRAVYNFWTEGYLTWLRNSKVRFQKPCDRNLLSGISLVLFTPHIICLFCYYSNIIPRSPKWSAVVDPLRDHCMLRISWIHVLRAISVAVIKWINEAFKERKISLAIWSFSNSLHLQYLVFFQVIYFVAYSDVLSCSPSNVV
jgi:hypothetical protein